MASKFFFTFKSIFSFAGLEPGTFFVVEMKRNDIESQNDKRFSAPFNNFSKLRRFILLHPKVVKP